MDRLPSWLKNLYTRAFSAADAAYNAGRVVSTAKARKTHWRRWVAFVTPLGLDPYLQDTTYRHRIRALTGFAAIIREGLFNKGDQVRAPTVSSALTAVGKACALANGIDPTKCPATGKFHTRIQEMLDGWRKQDPATTKELPVEADVPEYLVALSMVTTADEKDKAVADLVTVAYYYLLRVGEYTAKGKGTPESGATQTRPFKMKDVAFFAMHSKTKQLYRLPPTASDWDIMNAASATLKLDNQKNGWKDVCINHEHNLDDINCGVRALGRRYCHIRKHTNDPTTPIFTYFVDGNGVHVINKDIREAVKLAATALDYEGTRGTPIKLINTHSLRIGGACALALGGFTDTQIMKMGRWRSGAFREYVRENLSNYAEGMSKAMKKCHYFVNIDSGTYTDVSSICEKTAYGEPVVAVAA